MAGRRGQRQICRHRKAALATGSMMPVRYLPLPDDLAAAMRAGTPDANGQPPERHISDGSGLPCRHCLNDIAAGEAYLLFAHRPFSAVQPYAELGPVFIHANPCPAFSAADTLPPVFQVRDAMLIRGYDAHDRIVEGTGRMVPTQDMTREADLTLADKKIAYVHVRSARNNCFQCRIERA